MSRLRWFVFAPVAILAIFSSSVPAYATNPIITAPTDYWFEYEETTQFIAQTYMIEGYNSDPQLWLYNEAGVELITNDDHFGLQSFISIEIPAGKYRLRAGTCCYQPDVWRGGNGWNEQYELSFNGVGSMQTTTTVAPTTATSTSTSTTSTTTTSTTTTSTTSTTTTTTVAPTTTTTTTLPQTTTSTTTTTTTVPETTTTTSTTTTSTVPTTTTTNVSTTTVDPTTTTTTVVLPTTSTSTSTTTSSTTTIPTTTTTVAPIVGDAIDEQVLDLVASASALPPEKIRELITTIISDGVGKSEAVLLSSDRAVIASATTEQVTEILSAVDEGSLTDEQGAAIVSAIQNQVVEVREIFEKEINVFDGHTDTYVAVGSAVTIGQRRVIIVASALLLVPVMPVRKPNE